MTRRKNGKMTASALGLLEPEVLKVVGEESQRQGTDKLTSRQIGRIIKAARSQKLK